jgi:PAS domain S-box-containing protein
MPEKPTYKDLENRISELEAAHQRYAQVEVELKRSLQFTESLLTAIPIPIFFKDSQGRYIGCNPAFTELMGVSDKELSGKTVQELWPSEHASVYHQKDLELIENQNRQIYEFKVRDKNGKNRPAIFSKNVFYDEDGNVAGLVGGFVDITERKRAEDALRESEERLVTAGRAAYDLIYEWDVASDALTWFGDIDGMLGYRKGEIFEDINAWLSLIHPGDMGKLKNAVEIHRKSTKPIIYEYRVRHEDGSYRYWKDHGLPLLNNH